MKPTRLILRGAKGIKEGLGLDEITLDLAGLAGLVVLDGGNGRGKTTVLDNLHPYRMLPSRPKQALPHHFNLSDSCRDLTQRDSQGNTWRFLIKIDGPRGKQEGYIYLNDSTESLVSSLKQYDAKVAELMGSEDLFFSSAFAAQRQDDGKMTVGDLRKQLSEYLKLHEHQERSETAKDCAKTLAERIESRDRRAGEVQEQMFPLSDAADRLKDEQTRLEANQKLQVAATDKLKVLKSDREKLLARQMENEKAKARLAEIEKQIGQAREAVEAARGVKTREISAQQVIIKSAQALIDQLTEATAGAESITTSADRIIYLRSSLDDIAESRKVLEQEITAIRSNMDARQNTMNRNRSDLQDTETVLQQKIDAIAEKEQADSTLIKAEIEALEKKIGHANMLIEEHHKNIRKDEKELVAIANDSQRQDIELRIAMAESATADLKVMDPDCVSIKCGLSASAIKARDSLPALHKELEERLSHLSTKSTEINNRINNFNSVVIAAERKRIEDAQGSITVQKQQLQVVTDDAKALRHRAIVLRDDSRKFFNDDHGRLSMLQDQDRTAMENISDQIIEYDGRSDQIRTKINQLKDFADRKEQLAADLVKLELAKERKIQLDSELLSITTRHDDIILKLATELSTLRDNAAAIEIDKRVDSDIKDTDALIADNEDKRTNADNVIAEANTSIAYLEKDVLAFNKLAEELKAINAGTAHMTQEVKEWKYLELALGPNGLQALEIEFATPVICGVANELLSESFNGAGMQVKMKTLTDVGKETLQLWVIREDGSETLLENLSGGERVWVLKALRLSRLIMAKENSGFDYLAAFGDEEDGALRHGETSENFIGLYRAFRQRARFDVCYYISHKKECIAMADRVISFHRAGDPDEATKSVFAESGITIG